VTFTQTVIINAHYFKCCMLHTLVVATEQEIRAAAKHIDNTTTPQYYMLPSLACRFFRYWMLASCVD
jgi:hypothetical protein